MMKYDNVMTREETAVFELRTLYAEHGYSQYRMSKFEEYDLYVKNKDFLVSDNVITFTDTDGRLLALKPDVTLSIIKNSRDLPSGAMKVYYNENVYRVSRGTHTFKEIMQVGLECIGEVDDDMVTEVLSLAAASLDAISRNNVLEVSHLDIVSGVLNFYGLSEEGKARIFTYLGQKNSEAIAEVCDEEKISDEGKEQISALANVYGAAKKVMPQLRRFSVDSVTEAAVNQLCRVLQGLDNVGALDKISVDFSVVNDMNYYNGIAIKGFVDGISTGILSGGQYDKLMAKMHRKSSAIGFAVYLDELEKLSVGNREE